MNTALMTELFGGAGRYKALRCLFEHADKSFGTRELASAAGVDPGNASRWLRRWADIGLLERHADRTGRLTVFRASKNPDLLPLKLLLQQDSEIVRVLRAQLEAIDEDVTAAAIFGSVARGETYESSDIDVLLLAHKLCWLEAQAHFKPAARKLGRPVNVQVYTPQAWQEAVDSGNTFASDVMGCPVIILKGTLDG
jgi:predicted nucleotidyltransferase